MSAARSSDQPRAPGWCAARVCRIDGPDIPAEVLGDPANDRWLLDAGDDAQPAAALPAGLDVDGEHPPIRQWVLSFPYPLRFLFAHRREVMGRVLGIVYRCIATHLTGKAGYFRRTAQTGAVTLLQRFGSALNLNVRFHMLFLDGVYVERHDGSLWFRWVTARQPASSLPD